ncbi:hypothetical protein JKP88DRAFT_272166 [Tribonema minus]|uniref:Uncharacterized protein n=1 Tax=Tribonema minus TaxID=303371 RepID=A0A836CRE2_9STRA|nr:hypothetical protein JKP88DRAFT_272166 [Tribonema minus]
MSFNFSRFDPREISKRPVCIAIVGMRGTGKSVLLKDILYHINEAGAPRCVVFSGTEGANSYFSEFVPGVFVHPMDQDTLHSVWERQKELVLKKAAGGLPASTNTSLVLVLDDCAFNRKYLIDLNVAMRSNVDIYFFLKELNRMNREKIYKETCGFLPNYHVFEQLFNDATADYETFVVNSRCTSSNPEDIVHHYKADAGLQYRYGPPCLWRYHHSVYESPQQRYQRQQEALRRDGGGKKSSGTGGLSRAGGKTETVVLSRR